MKTLFHHPFVRRPALLLIVFALGGLGGVVFDRLLIPWIAAHEPFATSSFFQRAADRVTVINKTEQIVIREDSSVATIAAQPARSVVTVIRPVTSGEMRPVERARPGAESRVLNGLLLTNDGLLAVPYTERFSNERSRVEVRLADETVVSGEYVAADPLIGFVFYRIAVENGPVLTLANSDDIQTGQRIIALAPSWEENSLRLEAGYITGFERTLNLAGKTVSSSERWEGVLSTTVVDQHFIGSPAVQHDGTLVGVFIALPQNGEQKMFLLPAGALRASLDRALSGTLHERAVLGVYYRTLTPVYARTYGYETEEGALIFSPSGKTGLAVLAGSPGEAAGLRVGDIILSVGGDTVDVAHPLSTRLARYSRGDTIPLTILRSGGEQTVSIVFPRR